MMNSFTDDELRILMDFLEVDPLERKTSPIKK